MSKDGERLTWASYNNPVVAEGYERHHGLNPKMQDKIRDFIATLPGKRILDVGCGSGHDCYYFQELGCTVTGIDYSEAMVEVAKRFKDITPPPTFLVADARYLEQRLAAETFDGVWSSACLIHLSATDMLRALMQINRLLRPGGKAFIGVKGGTPGEYMVTEERYGAMIEREFVYWNQEDLEKLLTKADFQIDRFLLEEKSRSETETNLWLQYWLTKKV